MNKRVKYLLVAFAAVVIVSNVMLSSKARTPKRVPTPQLGPDFYQSIPADVIKLRGDLEQEAGVYEEMMRPYNAKLDDVADSKLSAQEAEELMAEVELKTGEQARKVNDLRTSYNSRIKELHKAYTAKKAKSS